MGTFAADTATAVKRLSGKKILVAEDVEMNQQLIRHILEAHGATAVIASNGVEALAALVGGDFDCILMDVQMPEMDGIQSTVQIRRLTDKKRSSIPIIALTANCSAEDLASYRVAGMNDFVAKPVVEIQLVEMIAGYADHALTPRNHATAPPPVSDNLYDLTMIRSVSGGDESFILKMILLFIETVPPNVQALVDATATANWDQVSKMAHKLKSTIDSMGIRSIHDEIRSVEMNAKLDQDRDQIPALVDRVESVISACIQQLRQEVA